MLNFAKLTGSSAVMLNFTKPTGSDSAIAWRAAEPASRRAGEPQSRRAAEPASRRAGESQSRRAAERPASRSRSGRRCLRGERGFLGFLGPSTADSFQVVWLSGPWYKGARNETARVPLPLFGGDKRDDNAKIFAAEKIVKYRAICMALDVSPRNSSAAVPAVQPDRKSRRGASNRR